MNNPRFRAIDPETGEDVTKHALVGVAFLRDFESWAKQMEEQGDFILSQSTGLTDARGNEVFDGDVLWFGQGYPLVVESTDGMFVGTYYRDWIFEKGFPSLPLNTFVDRHWIIGNRYEKPDTLRARAEEVMNG